MSVPTTIADVSTSVTFRISSATFRVTCAAFLETLGVREVKPGFVIILVVLGSVIPVMHAG